MAVHTHGLMVVVYGAKILILMQITTRPTSIHPSVCCCLWCKDTNFNANHNDSAQRYYLQNVVVYGAKILILMQITTLATTRVMKIRLLFMVQRY